MAQKKKVVKKKTTRKAVAKVVKKAAIPKKKTVKATMSQPEQPFDFTDQFLKEIMKLEAKDKYYSLVHKIVMLAMGKIHAMMVKGDVRVGKSTIARQVLESLGKNEGKDFVFIRGYSTPMALYEALFNNRERNKITIIDDCDSVLKNKTALDILKAVLDDKFSRTVSYRSRRQNKDLPQEFTFSGSVIFLTNYKGKRGDDHLFAVENRCHVQELFLTPRQKLEYIEKIVLPIDYKTTTQQERKAVFKLMSDVVRQGSQQFTCRTFNQLLDHYQHDPKNISIHLSQTIPGDTELTYLMGLLNNRNLKEMEEIQTKYMAYTNKSRRTYFNHLNRAKEILPQTHFRWKAMRVSLGIKN